LLRGCIEGSPALRSLIVNVGADSVEVMHPSGRTVEIAVVAGSKAAGGLASRWSAGLILDECTRMVGADESVANMPEALSVIRERLLPGAQIQAIGSPWAPYGPAYDMFGEFLKEYCAYIHMGEFRHGPLEIVRPGEPTMLILTGNDGFGASGKKQLEELAKTEGIEIVANEVYDKQATDLTDVLTKVKSTPGVQAVVNWSIVPAQSIVAKNMKQLGMNIPLFQSHGFGNRKYVEQAGVAAEGILFPAGRLLVVDELPASNPQKQLLATYKKDYEAAYQEDVSTFGGHAYDALLFVTEAIKKAKSTDSAKVRDAIESLKNHAVKSLPDTPQNPARRWDSFRGAADCTREEIDSIKRHADHQRHAADLLTTQEDRALLLSQTWKIVESYIKSLADLRSP